MNDEHGPDDNYELPKSPPLAAGTCSPKRMDKSDMLALLMRCQEGRATCMFVLDKIEEGMDELIDLLISARAIAQRKGVDTAWERFDARLAQAGIGSVTAKVFKVLPSDETGYAPAAPPPTHPWPIKDGKLEPLPLENIDSTTVRSHIES